MVPVILCFQVVPLIVFPLDSYKISSQEWWLPVLLCLLTLISLVQILVRKNMAAWPWYLLSFSQGFNIISRILMVLPHATFTAGGGTLVANWPYIAIAFASMLVSAFEIWYCEMPEVRKRLAARGATRAAA